MALIESARRGGAMLALLVGVCAAGPSAAEDWRLLQSIDLPAPLVRATWSEGQYLSEGHGVQFGRMAVYLQPSETRMITVKLARNGDGLVIDNLTCYNTVLGVSSCTMLLVRPRFCHLFVELKSKVSDSDRFDLDCPADLQLGN